MFSFFKKEKAARAAEAAKAAAEAAAWRAGEAERNRAAAQLRAAYAAQQSATPQHDAHVQKYRTHKALQQVIKRMRESTREYRVAKYRENPSAFDPDRFTEAHSRGRHPFSYLPFGGGKRICIGMRLAMMEVTAILAGVIRRIRFAPDPYHVVRPRAKITLRPEGGMPLYVSPRRTTKPG